MTPTDPVGSPDLQPAVLDSATRKRSRWKDLTASLPSKNGGEGSGPPAPQLRGEGGEPGVYSTSAPSSPHYSLIFNYEDTGTCSPLHVSLFLFMRWIVRGELHLPPKVDIPPLRVEGCLEGGPPTGDSGGTTSPLYHLRARWGRCGPSPSVLWRGVQFYGLGEGGSNTLLTVFGG